MGNQDWDNKGQASTKVPLVGFSPMILFIAAGIRPDPPVSVPIEKQTCF